MIHTNKCSCFCQIFFVKRGVYTAKKSWENMNFFVDFSIFLWDTNAISFA